MAHIVVSQVNSYDITCYIAGLDTSYALNDRTVAWYYNDIYRGTSYLPPHVSSGGSFKVIGLSPSTFYSIRTVITYNTGTVTLNTSTITAPIAPWEWYTPKATMNDMLNPVTRSEWLAFCNKINEIRLANGLPIYPFTTSITYIDTDKPFPAWIFLQAANAISDLGGVAPQVLAVKSMSEDKWGTSSILYPWYFTNLRAALNNAIP